MNNSLQGLQDFLTIQSINIPLWGFILDLILAAILSYILSVVYVKFGSSLSNRRNLAKNFIILALTTTLVIAVVKSSLALSLGLVGALSIVRFRAAIKEPEELMYLFLTIAIGLGLGASQRLITIVALLIIILIIWFNNRKVKVEEDQNLLLNISGSNAKDIKLENVVDILQQHCSLVNLRRFDKNNDKFEVTFLVNFSSLHDLQTSQEQLEKLDSKLHLSYLDNKGIV